ncbi:MAG: rhodanese-like domain-containing protein [Rhizomicrobium sp.]
MPTTNATPDYAGDLDVRQTWDILSSDPKAQLIDVRTAAEWTYVGLPDLSGLGRQVHAIEWQSFPSGEINPDFPRIVAEQMKLAGAGTDAPLLFLCRSGARSKAAAVAMTRAGFTRAYNVAGGFEGNLDGEGHRGTVNGWKASGLPWRQG